MNLPLLPPAQSRLEPSINTTRSRCCRIANGCVVAEVGLDFEAGLQGFHCSNRFCDAESHLIIMVLRYSVPCGRSIGSPTVCALDKQEEDVTGQLKVEKIQVATVKQVWTKMKIAAKFVRQIHCTASQRRKL